MVRLETQIWPAATGRGTVSADLQAACIEAYFVRGRHLMTASNAKTLQHRAKFAILLMSAWLAACEPFELEPLPLEITLVADRTTAARGDSILFTITAQGGTLLGIGIDWGDGQSLAIPTSGARTATTHQGHAYSESGTYNVLAEVTDAEAGSKNASLSVRIE
jgi:hypothetical protein